VTEISDTILAWNTIDDKAHGPKSGSWQAWRAASRHRPFAPGWKPRRLYGQEGIICNRHFTIAPHQPISAPAGLRTPIFPSRPGATQLASGPTFAGYPCSPTVSENGLPTWLIVDGKQAQRREKQGDVWYSVKCQDGSYDQVLRIPKGETAPPVMGVNQ
jgi:hypothetical protein